MKTNRNPIPATDRIRDLARAFARELSETLTAAELRDVNAKNARETDPGVCHSHDHCDANMPMLDAWDETFAGEEFDANNDAQAAEWNAAWDVARLAGFDPDAVPDPTQPNPLPEFFGVLVDVWQTGGGCTALAANIGPEEAFHFLLTGEDADAYAGGSEWCFGLYGNGRDADGEALLSIGHGLPDDRASRRYLCAWGPGYETSAAVHPAGFFTNRVGYSVHDTAAVMALRVGETYVNRENGWHTITRVS